MFRFIGDEREIAITARRNGQEPEFDAWRWEPLANVVTLVVPFRRAVYQAVATEFGWLVASSTYDGALPRGPGKNVTTRYFLV